MRNRKHNQMFNNANDNYTQLLFPSVEWKKSFKTAVSICAILKALHSKILVNIETEWCFQPSRPHHVLHTVIRKDIFTTNK
jgi:hypothetical protein